MKLDIKQENLLIDEYVIRNTNIRQLSKKFGISKEDVSNILMENEIPFRNKIKK